MISVSRSILQNLAPSGDSVRIAGVPRTETFTYLVTWQWIIQGFAIES